MTTHPSRTRLQHGFTLVELLVVVVIIISLAALVMIGTRKAMAGAHQSKNVNQMRDIGAAVAMWASEHNNGEPMYFANGTGDYVEEGALSGKNPLLAPGNPAMLLYNKDAPSEGYLQKPAAFFAATQKCNIPSDKDYDPSRASKDSLWGSFMWVYPSVPAEERTERQKTIMRSSSYTTVSRQAYNNLLMFNDYSFAKPKNPKDKSYFALFRDGTVRNVATNGNIWGWFFKD